MIAEYLSLNIPIKDKDFDMIYPAHLRKLSKRHFTRVEIAIKAARFLGTDSKQKVLDIGSGAGKFCFVAGSYSNTQYTGVDYRKHFIELSSKLAEKHRFKNVRFIHRNITEVDFSQYNGFYFYNSFQEQIDNTCIIDESVEVNEENYSKFSAYLKKEWTKMPVGTRIVTYHTYLDQIPDCYTLVEMHFEGLLKCWEKTNNPIGKLI